jgi:hypothetical protein
MIEDLLDQSEALADPPSHGATARMKAALDCAGIGEGMVVLNGFGPAYGTLQAMADEALKALGATSVSGEDMLADESLVATVSSVHRIDFSHFARPVMRRF